VTDFSTLQYEILVVSNILCNRSRSQYHVPVTLWTTNPVWFRHC